MTEQLYPLVKGNDQVIYYLQEATIASRGALHTGRGSLEGASPTYGHSQLKTGHPVRSAIHKQLNGRLVLRWVTTWESLL
ncbi:hypothetical protein KCU78_g2934, partial [Aureobasidium melanogenum]